jgi:hypothetical protein
MRCHRLFQFVSTSLLVVIAACSSKGAGTIAPQEREWFESRWHTVDSLDRCGLPKSSLEVVNEIVAKAETIGGHGMAIKGMIYRFRYLQAVEEETFVKVQQAMTEAIAKEPFPYNALLHSMLAEQFWSYYENNQWKIIGRSKTADFKQDDIRTWDLSKILDAVLYHYERSVADADKLKEISIDRFSDVIEKEERDSVRYRPTLYDFLTHRAIDFFMRREAGVTRPADQFTLNDPRFMAGAETFARYSLSTLDTQSFDYRALRHLQRLIAFHLSDGNLTALVDVDLERLSFVYANAVIEGKDSLYEKTLRETAARFAKTGEASRVLFALASLYAQQRESHPDDPRYKGRFVKALALCKEAADRYPGTDGACNCAALAASIGRPTLALTIESAVAPARPFLVRFAYRNTRRACCKLYKFQSADAIDRLWDKNANERRTNEEFVKLLLTRTPVREWETALPVTNDYAPHTVDAIVEGLPVGHYLLLAGDDPQFSRQDSSNVVYGTFQATAIAYFSRNEPYGREYRLVDRTSGAPLAGATARIWVYVDNPDPQRSSNEILTRGQLLTADAGGLVRVPGDQKGQRMYLELCKGADRLLTKEEYSYDDGVRGQTDESTLRTVYFTDRALYRPGQTVYYKGILVRNHSLDPEKTGPAKASLEVKLYDVNGRQVAEQKVSTNGFGAFSGSFVLPLGLLNGSFRIADSYGGTEFSVEEYKRPKFAVTFDPLTADYRLGSKITVTGKALALAGFPIDNAKVSFRVVRRPWSPCWYWWWGPRQGGETELLSDTAVTGSDGSFTVTFTAAPDRSVSPERSPEFQFEISASVTDLNGETRGAETSLSAGYALIRLSASLPAEIDKSEKPPHLSVNAANAAGMPQKASGSIRVTRLRDPGRAFKAKLWQPPDTAIMTKAEFYKRVDAFAYTDENRFDRWEKEKTVFTAEFSTPGKDSFALESIASWESGIYLVEATAKDRENNPVRTSSYVTVYSTKENKPPFTTTDWFLAPRTTLEPGEHIRLLVGSSEPGVRVLLETLYREKIVKTEFVSLDREQKVIDIPVREEYRGNIGFAATFVRDNRFYRHEVTIEVPWTNKKLDIAFGSFRSVLLPGQKEEWRLTIKGPSGEAAAAEMVATLYDASLDQIMPHAWYFSPYSSFYSFYGWGAELSRDESGATIWYYPNSESYCGSHAYDYLNWFGFSLWGNTRGMMKMEAADSPVYSAEEKTMEDMKDSPAAPKMPQPSAPPAELTKEKSGALALRSGYIADAVNDKRDVSAGKKANPKPAAEPPRKNLRETAFFYPHLTSDAAGNVTISFSAPEALTKWKMLGLAHTKDLKYGFVSNELVTRKELMVVPSLPRFLREGDKMTLCAKVVNMGDKPATGTARLQLFDAATMQPIDERFGNTTATAAFSAPKGGSARVSWHLSIPEKVEAVAVRITAEAGTFSDGEEQLLPVVKNSMLVTETMPLPLRSGQTRKFTLDKLAASGSSTTLRHHGLTLEFTANPAWYAVQSLPYLMEFPHECMEQLFNRFYANAVGSYIIGKRPQIKAVFDQWRANPSSGALLATLEKNPELKSLILDATPWVREANSDAERKKRIALLFDFSAMTDQLSSVLDKLEQGQGGNGAWPWFPGMEPNRYITQYLVAGIAHLERLGVLQGTVRERAHAMAVKALTYLDICIREDYEWLLKNKANLAQNNLGSLQIQYLYVRSYFSDPPVYKNNLVAVNYYKGQARTYWLDNDRYLQGMIALAFHRFPDGKGLDGQIMKSIKEHALYSDEMGMYWKDSYGYYWYENAIETHALMVEAFSEINKDAESVDGLRTWLLKNKQTNDWGNTKSTAEACYALLLNGENWLAEDKPPEITLGTLKVWPPANGASKAEAGTGYFKKSWPGDSVVPSMGTVTVVNRNKVVAWGALYWQYFERLDKITPHATPLSIVKKLFVERPSKTGPVLHPIDKGVGLGVGDRIIVRIELRVDRDMEFVHMADMRAAGFEPENVLSQCKWQDNLCYYESTRDAATHFFFDRFPKGTYVFEYPLRVSQAGDFSNGITTIECMYAPEFASHSEGVRVTVHD